MNIRFVLFICCLTFLFGCQENNADEALPLNQDNKQFIQVEDSSPENKQVETNENIAKHLAAVAEKIPNVNDAYALVAGPYAIVTIDVDENLDRSRVGTIKYSVTEALRNDPYGKTAVVIADGDINQRIRNMGDKIQQGYPVQGIVDELAAIIGRYIPDLPVPENKPAEPDQNKEIIPQDEQEELDRTQDKQSNDRKNEQK